MRTTRRVIYENMLFRYVVKVDIKKTSLILLILLLLNVVFVAGVLYYRWQTQGEGSIGKVKVECYWDEANTLIVSSIGWGMLEPGETKTMSFYVRSLSNVATTLFMRTENWQPVGVDTYISVSWDSEGASLNGGAQRLVALTITVFPNIVDVDTFSFTTVIEAQG